MEKYSPKFYKYFKDDKKIEYYIYIYSDTYLILYRVINIHFREIFDL